MDSSKGILYICATPIGNLEDITFRAIRVLKEVDLILCEDTRTSKKLLHRYDINNKIESYHKFNEKTKSPKIIELLKEGKNIALISDAGTPLINDPGLELIKQAKANSIKISPIPGACAFVSALSAVGVDGDFVFGGFLPKKASERKKLFKKHQTLNAIYYESPKRLVSSLKDAFEALGDRKAIVAREITKIHEEFKECNISELVNYYTQNPPRGEIVLIIEKSEMNEEINININEKISQLKALGYSAKDISKILSSLYPVSKKEVYGDCIYNNMYSPKNKL